MSFSRYNSFPFKFGSRKASISKAIVTAISTKLNYAYSDDEDSFSWAELYALSKAVEYIYRANQAAITNAIPGKATFSLDTWEKLFGISPNPYISDVERRNILAAKWLNLSNDIDYLEKIVKKIYGNGFDSIVTYDTIQYWALNPSPIPGYDWVSSKAKLIIHIKKTSRLTPREYDRKKIILAEILNDIVAIYTTFYMSYGDYFKCGIGKLGYNPLG